MIMEEKVESFKGINFSPDFEYSSDTIYTPLHFYLKVLPRSKFIALKLGYFSSNAFQILACGFARFILNNGSISIITNHYLYDDDRELLEKNKNTDGLNNECINFENIFHNLTASKQHLINCLKNLISNGKLEIIPVVLKPKKMTHYKQGYFIDHFNNALGINGSCNFTANGLLGNAESISVFREWGSEYEKQKVISYRNDIDNILQKKDARYEYLEATDIYNAIDKIGIDKDVSELLDDELQIIKEKIPTKEYFDILSKEYEKAKRYIKIEKSKPKFPFKEGPRNYQVEAYQKWVKNGKNGIFAMATGTGKTITSLNCLLQEYKNENQYRAIILVPSKTLLEQWYEEAKSFNFQNIIKCSSDYNYRKELRLLNRLIRYGNTQSYIIISTYQTFAKESFRKAIKNATDRAVLICDEAHNVGSNLIRKQLSIISFDRKIALTATPKRAYDPIGNSFIEEYFNDYEPYTYSFTMEKAINEHILCPYFYFPKIVKLTYEETVQYKDISVKLLKYFDEDKKQFQNQPEVERLLNRRKQIIHKAENKKNTFRKIISELKNKKDKLQYTFVYAPEGYDSENNHIINEYVRIYEEEYPDSFAHIYIGESEGKKETLESFKSGDIHTLFSMKCLDEGVDIPRAEIGIFCSSTGNPRQFIQRRGRLLRRHPDKDYAIIYDIIVFPDDDSDFKNLPGERALIKGELKRVIHFAKLAQNYYDAMEPINRESTKYGIDVFALENDLME